MNGDLNISIWLDYYHAHSPRLAKAVSLISVDSTRRRFKSPPVFEAWKLLLQDAFEFIGQTLKTQPWDISSRCVVRVKPYCTATQKWSLLKSLWPRPVYFTAILWFGSAAVVANLILRHHWMWAQCTNRSFIIKSSSCWAHISFTDYNLCPLL